jgi:hypothetical protein
MPIRRSTREFSDQSRLDVPFSVRRSHMDHRLLMAHTCMSVCPFPIKNVPIAKRSRLDGRLIYICLTSDQLKSCTMVLRMTMSRFSTVSLKLRELVRAPCMLRFTAYSSCLNSTHCFMFREPSAIAVSDDDLFLPRSNFVGSLSSFCSITQGSKSV